MRRRGRRRAGLEEAHPKLVKHRVSKANACSIYTVLHVSDHWCGRLPEPRVLLPESQAELRIIGANPRDEKEGAGEGKDPA
jgi:hypothetical protein